MLQWQAEPRLLLLRSSRQRFRCPFLFRGTICQELSTAINRKHRRSWDLPYTALFRLLALHLPLCYTHCQTNSLGCQCTGVSGILA